MATEFDSGSMAVRSSSSVDHSGLGHAFVAAQLAADFVEIKGSEFSQKTAIAEVRSRLRSDRTGVDFTSAI
jgi:hypothetical protein